MPVTPATPDCWRGHKGGRVHDDVFGLFSLTALYRDPASRTTETGMAGRPGMNVLRQPGDATVDDLCDRVLRCLGPRAPRPL